MPTALVTDAERASALSIIRSLDRRGWRVIAGSSRRLAAGLWSRHATARVRYPDPLVDAPACLERLRAVLADQGVDVLFPVSEYVGVPLLHNREIATGCRVALGDPDAMDIVNDKAATLDLATSLGVPTPASVLAVNIEAARAAASELGWPVVVKPTRSLVARPGAPSVRVSVAHASNSAELDTAVAELGTAGPVLIQRYHDGEGQAVNLLARDGHVLAALQQRRLREYPLSGGPGTCRETVRIDDSLLDHASKLIRALRWNGVAMVEFKVGRRGPALMEINGRVWGSSALGAAAGLDFAALWADELLGRGGPIPATPDTGYAVGVRSRSLTLELKWIASVLGGAGGAGGRLIRRREALRVGAGLVHPAAHLDTWSVRDPLPLLAEAVGAVASIAERARRG